MKKLFPLFIVFFLWLNVKADHTAGAEITYKSTSTPGVLEVHFVYFRDCTGIPVCSGGCGAACTRTISIMGADPSCVSATFGTFTVSLTSVRDIADNMAKGTKTICSNMSCATTGTFTPAFERYEFVGFANIGPTSGIPSSCCNVRFVFNECCRSAQIATGSTWQNFYIEASVNRCYALNNSSPVYSYDPIMVHCGGQPVMYNMGASYDPDGDSISYAFTPALQANNSSVTYNPPWAYDRPLPWTGNPNADFPGGIRCDPLTGVVSFTSGNSTSSNFYGVLAVEVKQWRNVSGIPTLVGRTVRDVMTVILSNCPPNNIPRVLTYPPNGTNPNAPKTDYTFPAGIQSCITMAARDTDYIPPVVTDTTFIDTPGLFMALGASFTRLASPGVVRDSVRFCWTPALALRSAQPYILPIRVRDSRKPMEGKALYAFTIKVPLVPAITNNEIKDSAKACNFWNFSYTLAAGSPSVAQARWSISRLLPGNVPSPYYTTTITGGGSLNNKLISDSGRYLVTLDLFGSLTDSNVVSRYTDTIVVLKNAISVTGSDTTVCAKTNVTLTSSVKNAVGSQLIRWQDSSSFYTSATRTTNSKTGNRWLTVSVQDSLGCFYMDTVYLKVFPSPDLKIVSSTDTIQCEKGNNFKLYNNTNRSGFSGTTYKWLLDDSLTFTADTIQFSLSGAGMHVLKLMSTNAQGCRDTVQRTLQLRATPRALFTVNDSTQCFKGNTFLFTNQSTNTDGSMTHVWSTATNTFAGTNYTYSYNTSGQYTVRLIATNNLATACKDTFVKQMWVYPQPNVTNTINNAAQCVKNNNFVFTNTTVPDSTLSFKWFIEGDTSSALIVSRSYAAEGNKTAKLLMTSSYGCNDSLTKSFSISASPVAAFTTADTIKCLRGNSFTFTNQSSINNSGQLSYNWNMGNGNTSTNTNPTYTYPASGTFTVRLITSNAAATQCKDTVTKTVTIYPQPALTGTVNNSSQCLASNNFVFTNTSVDLNNANYTFSWRVESSVKTGTNITEKFTSAGTKTVWLKSLTNKGCLDSTALTAIVNAHPVAQMTINDTDQCIKGNSFVFTSTSTGALTNTFIIDGATPVTGLTVTRSFTSTGIKNVRLAAVNNAGCRDTSYRQVEVLYSPVAAFSISDSTVCKNTPVTFTNTASNPVVVSTGWLFENNLFDTSVSVTRGFSSSGVKRVTMMVTTEKGCTDSMSKNVTVYASPSTPVISGPASAMPLTSATYAVAPNPALFYQWKINNGRITSSNTNTHTVDVLWDSTSAYGRMFLSTRTIDGCDSDTSRFDVSIIGGTGLAGVNASFSDMGIFPNPTTGTITLSLNSIRQQSIGVKIFNIVGTEVRTYSFAVRKGMMEEELNLQDLQKGVYFMRIEGEGGSQTVKILLK